MIIKLQVTSSQSQSLGDSAQKNFDHKGGSFGRATHNAWVLPDDSKTISGQHGMVYFESGNFYLTDISTNGIFVNGSPSPLGKGNVIALRDGDLLCFGEYEVKVSALVADDGVVSEQQTAATSSFFTDEATPLMPENTAAQSGLESKAVSFGDAPEDIESSNFDPLAAGPDTAGGGVFPEDSGKAGQSERNANPFAASIPTAKPGIPDTGYQHSSAMLDPYTKAAVTLDPDLAAPAQSDQSASIPEDWNLTGFSNPLAANNQATEDGKVSPGFIPEDTSFLAEPEKSEIPSSKSQIPPAAQMPPQSEQTPAIGQAATPVMGQLTPQQNSPPPAARHSAHETAAIDPSYQAFMQGLGLKLTSLNPNQDPIQVMTTTGQLFREVIHGLMTLLQARSELKSQFRMSATTIRPTENNPLKFSPDVDEALKALFADERTGYLKSEAAMAEGIKDIRNHQMAMIAGMQSAFTALLGRLHPKQFSADGKEGGVKASLLSGGKKSRAWEQYCDYYDNVVVKSGNAFQMLFGEDFNKAYEEQLRILESSRK